MDNKESPDINKILESIMNNIKTELNSIKSEITSDVKEKLDDIKSDLRDELDTIKSDLQSEIDTIRDNPPFSEPFEPPHPHNGFYMGGIFEMGNNDSTKTFEYADFSSIYIGGTFDADIQQADSYSITITAKEPLFHNLDVSKEGKILRIDHSRHIGWKIRLSRPKVTITMPLLKELRLSGAANAVLSGFNSTEFFRLNMSGASSITGDIVTGNTDIELSGASRGRLTGSAKDTIIKASGANRMDLRGFTVQNAAIKLSGASNLSANVTGRLDARLSGASNFSWVGNPIMGDIRTSGASRLTKE